MGPITTEDILHFLTRQDRCTSRPDNIWVEKSVYMFKTYSVFWHCQIFCIESPFYLVSLGVNGLYFLLGDLSRLAYIVVGLYQHPIKCKSIYRTLNPRFHTYECLPVLYTGHRRHSVSRT